MEKLELEIVALSNSVTQSQSYAVVLRESAGPRRLPIVIGEPEAQAIAVAVENLKPSRPLTHDLLKNVCDELEVRLHEVIISDLIEGIFHAKLMCEQNGNLFEIDSRTSDALALAVRFKCPIYTYEFILDKAGIVLEGEEERPVMREAPPQRAGKKANFKSHNLQKLHSMLEDAIKKEDYEMAARVRDEISKRE